MPELDWVDAPLPSPQPPPSALGGLSYGETDLIQNDAQRRSWEVLGQERDAVQGEMQRDKPLSDALSRDQGRYVGTEYGTVYDPPFRNIGWAGDAASALGEIVNPHSMIQDFINPLRDAYRAPLPPQDTVEKPYTPPFSGDMGIYNQPGSGAQGDVVLPPEGRFSGGIPQGQAPYMPQPSRSQDTRDYDTNRAQGQPEQVTRQHGATGQQLTYDAEGRPLGTARPISDQPSPYDEAVKQYPILQMQGVAAVPGRGGNMEFWPANEPGTPERPRPPNLPMNTPGLELGPQSRPIDVLGDIVSHHMVNKDPVIKKFYEGFTNSLTDNQREMLQAQYNYYVRNEGETRKYPDWEKTVGLPAYFRGYPFDQWPKEFNQEAYTPAQRDHLDKMMDYLREVQSAPAGAQKTSAGQGAERGKELRGSPELGKLNRDIQPDPYAMEELGIGGNPRPLSPDLPEVVRRQIAEEPSYSEYQRIPGKPNPLMEQEFEQGVHSGPQRDQALPEAIWRSRRYDDETNEPMPEGVPNYEYNPELQRPRPLDPRLYRAPMGQY